ncbi:MAG: 3-isopropylmalate dehydrogenase [Desulfuromonas sp. SDB]|nr:MAG: 3-isopropylmalate dehydrogenase [Desulfuromonas sp. SDB]
MSRTIVAMPGDGIGKIVIPEAIKLLEAVGFEADYVHADIGWEFWCKEGNPLPDRTLQLLEKYKIALFGAITSKPKDKAALEIDPRLKDNGFVYYSPIVGLRQHFNLDISIRPCRSFKGNPLNFIRRGKQNDVEEPMVDAVIFRQNTEGLYSGVEWTDPPDQVYEALKTHKKFTPYTRVPKQDLAISVRIFTRQAVERILQAAFNYAKKHGYKSVTICEKPNVIRETSGMMNTMAQQIGREKFPDIAVKSTNIDAQMMWLTKNPEIYEVIVAGNMFGDIVSDGFAGLVGGLGFACSANIGEEVAIFEPTHGSAPKYAEYPVSIVNPCAMFLSSAMMLDHIGENEKAEKIRQAVAKVVGEGKIRTYDMMKLSGSPQVIQQGAATTSEMTDAVINATKEI